MPADMPQISVLIPVYNVEAYLAECLESVLSQGFGDYEAIILNDGSTDGSGAIARDFVARDRRLRLIDKPNSGYGATMNLGLSLARGEYVAILESDDFYAPEALGALHQAASRLGAQVAKGDCWHHWTGPPARDLPVSLVPRRQAGRLVNPRQEREIFFRDPAIWAGLYRRDFLEEGGIGFLETPGASYQDTSFNFKVWALAERAVFLKRPVVHYRQDNAGSSVRSGAKALCVVDELAEMGRFLDERGAPGWLYAVRSRLMLDAYLWNYERLDGPSQLGFLRLAAAELATELDAGRLDPSSLPAWRQADLAAILRSPEDYHAGRLEAGLGSRWGKARHYMRLGGLPLLAAIARSKLVP